MAIPGCGEHDAAYKHPHNYSLVEKYLLKRRLFTSRKRMSDLIVVHE